MQPDPPSSPAPAPPVAWRIHRARAGDLREVVRAYLDQPPDSRALYHPLPFDRIRLVPLLYAIVAVRPLARFLARRVPRAAVMLYTARSTSSGLLSGFGTVRFRRASDGVLVVETGYYVLPEERRKGLGRLLKSEMIEEARSLGAGRAQALILPGNLPSVRLNESLGFRIHPTETRDRHAPDQHLLLAETDLSTPLRVRRPPRPEPSETAEPA
jgi:GNAT superfamily N-acetyltransferase